jgi:3-keto-5-aminohexanoate cleavage enzyme
MDPLIISCAVTGDQDPAQSPHIPASPEDIGRSAVEAWREGAAIVHLHARDDHGEPTGDAEYFRRAVSVIREAGSDVIVNLTTSFGGAGENVWDQRFAALEARPEIASLDCGTLNFGEYVFHNSVPFLRELASRMQRAGIKPELEIFDAGMVGTAARLAEDGLLAGPQWFQFVLGVAGGAPAGEHEVLHLRSLLPDGALWSVCALGRHQLPMNALAIVLGGHARTGLEDNLHYRKGELADNPRLVERVRRLADTLERPVATPSQARALLGLRGLNERHADSSAAASSAKGSSVAR